MVSSFGRDMVQPGQGVGSIDPDDGEPEIFVHDSGIQGRGYQVSDRGRIPTNGITAYQAAHGQAR